MQLLLMLHLEGVEWQWERPFEEDQAAGSYRNLNAGWHSFATHLLEDGYELDPAICWMYYLEESPGNGLISNPDNQ